MGHVRQNKNHGKTLREFFCWGADMAQRLDKYIGRIVRLNQTAFERLSRTATRQRGAIPDNYFVVAEISRQMHKLICYGANIRIVVGAADVVLV